VSSVFVVDASVALSWCFLDEATPTTKKLLETAATAQIAVPAWWYLEITNALYFAERKGRIEPTKIAEFIALLESFSIDVDNDGPLRAFSHLLPLCRKHQLTSYDAAYLDVALRLDLPLATLDEPLRQAAKSHGVKLLGK
jgi:predicted nucleic acid-binding protein